MTANTETAVSGYCRSCGKNHYIEQGMARGHCLDLIQLLENAGRIDFHVPEKNADPRLSLDYIKGEAMGQMFGVLEGLDQNNNSVILKAFSGQYNGLWKVEGWAPPLIDTEKFDLLVNRRDKEIKDLGKIIDIMADGHEKKELILQRKNMSQTLMKDIHGLYSVQNFRSETRSLFDLFDKGIPTGAGDCCAPKLLNAAAKQGIKPTGLAEIFWGRANRSRTRENGRFYTPCNEKCKPLLGFMLCGLD